MPWVSPGSAIVLQRSFHEIGWDQDSICPISVALHGTTDLQRQLGRHLFIRIDIQHPRISRYADPEVLLGPVARPVALEDSRPQRLSFLSRSIGAVSVNNDGFVRPGDTLEASFDVEVLILGDD